MARVKWLPEAHEDVECLYVFLDAKDKQAADTWVITILEGVQLLKRTPYLGRPMSDVMRQRELLMAFGAGAYVIRYKFEDAMTVVIIRVWHSRQDRIE